MKKRFLPYTPVNGEEKQHHVLTAYFRAVGCVGRSEAHHSQVIAPTEPKA
ncbi:MAG: hypothetical protein Q7T85_12355 [Nitrosomonas sp.]|nr:hypothetical protein [Nitrosomonas sp.]